MEVALTEALITLQIDIYSLVPWTPLLKYFNSYSWQTIKNIPDSH